MTEIHQCQDRPPTPAHARLSGGTTEVMGVHGRSSVHLRFLLMPATRRKSVPWQSGWGSFPVLRVRTTGSLSPLSLLFYSATLSCTPRAAPGADLPGGEEDTSVRLAFTLPFGSDTWVPGTGPNTARLFCFPLELARNNTRFEKCDDLKTKHQSASLTSGFPPGETRPSGQ